MKPTKQEVTPLYVDCCENTADDLCRLAEILGYDDWRPAQTRFANGAHVSSLIAFLNAHPGAIEAVKQYIVSHVLKR